MLEELFKIIEQKEGEILPDFSNAENVIIASDYREHSNQDKYLGISFLIANLDSLYSFNHHRLNVKEEFSIVGREMKYSKLGHDMLRNEALSSFLSSADTVDGILFTFLIDNDLGGFFTNSEEIRKNDPSISLFTSDVFRKLEWFSHLAAFFTSKLTNKQQKLWWVTDQDDMVINSERRDATLNFFVHRLNQYLSHNLDGLRFIDPEKDTEDRYLKDLTAIPDLAVGPLTDVYNYLKENDLRPQNNQFVHFPDDIKDKAVKYLEWLDANDKLLKKISFVVEPDPNIDKANYSKIFF